jgi:hypothetical protein
VSDGAPRAGRHLLPHLLSWQQRLLWRGARHGGVGMAENWILATIFALFVPSLFGRARRAAEAVGAGAEEALISTALLLLSVAGTWLAGALLLGGARPDGPGLSPRRLTRFPIGVPTMAIVAFAGFLGRPVGFVLIAETVLAFWPLVAAPAPVVGLLAGLAYFAGVVVVAWSLDLWISEFLSGRAGRWLGAGVAALLVLLTLIGLESGIERRDGRAELTTPVGRVVLDDGRGGGALPALREALPPVWVARAAMGAPLEVALGHVSLLAALAAAAAGLTVALLGRRLRAPGGVVRVRPIRALAITPLPGLPRDLGALVARDLRLQSRTPEGSLGLILGLVTTLLCVFWDDVVWWLLPITLSVLILNRAVHALNTFGLDGRGAARMGLWPVDGRRQMLARNYGFFVLTAGECGPPLLAGFFVFDATIVGAVTCGVVAVTCALAAFGNWRSLAAPAPRQAGLFGSTDELGGVVGLVGALTLLLAPAIVGLYTASLGPLKALAAQAVLAAVAGALWWFTLSLAGRRLERSVDFLRRAAG